ncbi:MAG TPA: EFR1 family ferrodoxin [Clostridia bacterium]|nr:EFR1 family ferrodoxin [Clostridia bacterium]
MRCLINCFSPTRNTYNLCEDMAKILRNNGYAVDIFDVTRRAIRERRQAVDIAYDLFVIAFPVYNQSIPDAYAEYLKHLKINAENGAIVATYGSVTIGNALSQANHILKEKGISIYGAAAIPAEHSYSSAFKDYGIYYDYSVELENFLKKVIYNVKNKKHVDIKGQFAVAELFGQKFLGKVSIKIPRVDKNKCVRCNKCITACPTDAIDKDLSISVKQCIRCAACVKVCEFGARLCTFNNPIAKSIVSKGVKNLGKLIDIT